MSIDHEVKELVVCFTDICNWLRGTEGKSPLETFTLLARVYEEVLPIAEQHGGRLIKVMGDGALIIWEAEDAGNAIEAARRMRHAFDELQRGFGPAEPMKLAVALALGPVFAGEMGPASIRRFDIFGHAANLAAQLLKRGDFVISEGLAEAASGTDLADIEIAPGV